MISIGDLSQTLVMKRWQAQLKSDVLTSGAEVTTGVAEDTGKHLKGDLTSLGRISADLSNRESRRIALSELGIRATSAQQSLTSINSAWSKLKSSLQHVEFAQATVDRNALSESARAAFGLTISNLNTQVAGRSLFSGVATDQQPLVGENDMLNEISQVLQGATTADEVEMRLDDWFSDTGGFAALGYLGSQTDVPPLDLGNGQRIGLSVRADDTVFRDGLKAMAMSVFATDSSLNLAPSEQIKLLSRTGDALNGAESDLINSMAKVGNVESRIDRMQQVQEAEVHNLEAAKLALTEIDQYEAATKLEQAQTQLEALYTIVSRRSQLSFLEVMR